MGCSFLGCLTKFFPWILVCPQQHHAPWAVGMLRKVLFQSRPDTARSKRTWTRAFHAKVCTRVAIDLQGAGTRAVLLCGKGRHTLSRPCPLRGGKLAVRHPPQSQHEQGWLSSEEHVEGKPKLLQNKIPRGSTLSTLITAAGPNFSPHVKTSRGG